MSTLKSPDEAATPNILALPNEIFCKIVGFSARRLMWIEVSKEVRGKISSSEAAQLALSIKLKTGMTEDNFVYFDRLTTLFKVNVGEGVKYGDIMLCSNGSVNQHTKDKFLACIKRAELFYIKREKAMMVAAVVPKCLSLVHLNLGCNNIGDEDLEGLVQVLRECKSLAHIDLSFNRIGAAGVGRLAALLPDCSARRARGWLLGVVEVRMGCVKAKNLKMISFEGQRLKNLEKLRNQPPPMAQG